MASIKILKDGATDINSTNVYDFAINSDYKLQKISSVETATLTMPSDSTSVSTSLSHGLSYKPVFFCYIEHDGKGYEAIGNLNPSIEVEALKYFSYFSVSDYITNRSTKAGGTGSAIPHGLVSGDTVEFKLNPDNTSLPSGISENTTYYYHSDFDTNSYYISETSGGAIYEFDTGSGADRDFWRKTNDGGFKTNVTFDIDVTTSQLNVTATTNSILGTNFNEEVFTIRCFFILDEIQ